MPEREDDTIPAGMYLLALTWFRRNRERQFLRCRFVVAAGELEGQGFFTAVSYRPSLVSDRILNDWRACVDAPSGMDIESDAQVSHAFRGRAFKALVKQKQLGRRTINDIVTFVYPRRLTDEERAAIKAFDETWRRRSWIHRHDDDPGPSDSDAPDEAQPQWSEGHPFAEDDDE